MKRLFWHGIFKVESMTAYETIIQKELASWKRKMLKEPGFFNDISKKIQNKINDYIPEKVHTAITATMKQMIKAVLFGSKITTGQRSFYTSVEERELAVREKIKNYRNTAVVEGGITGAGGILLGLADFPILLTIKIKLLFEIAALYGFDVKDYRERVFILYIFQLAFSSDAYRRKVFLEMQHWDEKAKQLPGDINEFNWRHLQQEYRDYIDLAKMAQLIPVIGAPVGAIANYQLVKKLGTTAMNAYRMRWFETQIRVAQKSSFAL